jgi:hypothetical protein
LILYSTKSMHRLMWTFNEVAQQLSIYVLASV